ncbi:MAG: hypothetical protein OSB47_08170 [Pirellulaceae bacterium]|nr:hypothetical protein [Pirellulaceae bacterium]
MLKLLPGIRWTCFLFMAFALVISAGCGKSKEESKSSTDATTVPYMHPEFRVAIVIRPQQLLSSELLATVTKSLPGDPVKEMVEEMTEGLDLNPNQIDRIVVLANSFAFQGGGASVPEPAFDEEQIEESARDEDAAGVSECEFVQNEEVGIEADEAELFPKQEIFYCAILDLVEGVDTTALAKKFTGSDQTVKHGEHTYYPQTGSEHDKPSVCVVSDSTILVAEEDHLKKILATGNAQSPLADELKTIDNTNDLSVVILVGKVVQDMGAEDQLDQLGSMPNPFIPPQISENIALTKDISAFTIGVNLKSDTPLQVGLATSNSEVADKLAGSLEELKKMGQEAIGQQDGEGNPIVEAATKAINGLTITNQNSRVGVALKMAPADLQAAVESIAPLLGLLGMGSSSGFEEGDFPIPEEGSNDPESDPESDFESELGSEVGSDTDSDAGSADLPSDVTKDKDNGDDN